MSAKTEIADVLNMPSEDVTRSYLFLTGTLVMYLVAGAITVLPSPADLVFALVFLVFWLGCPIALYFDRKHVAKTSEWTPSKLYYFGFLPGYLGVAAVGYYLYKRSGWYRSTLRKSGTEQRD